MNKIKSRLLRLLRKTTRSSRDFIKSATIIFVVLVVAFIGVTLKPHPKAYAAVPGQSYQICNETAQYLTSPWTYDSLASGSQSYTVAQYEAISGYGTTLPPLPSYISSQPSTTTAAYIFAPGSSVSDPAYDYPMTPVLYFFEGGTYSNLGLSSVNGDEFIGGSATSNPEPVFNDNGNAGGIDAGNGSFYYSGGSSTLAATANIGDTVVTTSSAIPGYIQYVTFSDGTTYKLANSSGDTLTLNTPLTNTESANSIVWANSTSPLATISSAASQGASTFTLSGSTVPMLPDINLVVGVDNYLTTSVTGPQSGYTVGVSGLDNNVTVNTPVYYNDYAGDVTVSYLNINDDQHNTTGTIYTGSNWTITHNDIHDGYSTPGLGVAIYGGDQGTIEYNCLSKMGDYGVNLFGTNNKFDYNEIYQSSYETDPGCGCSGAGKWWGTLNADIVDNAFVDDGPGGSITVWLDNGNTGTLIQGNYFDMSIGNAISDETGFNADITDNLFLDDNWGSGSGCGDSNCVGSVSMNSSGGFNIPGSRYENEVLISNNQFINDWGGVGIWQSGARSCENSGEGWPYDAPYCSGGFPNTATTAAGGAYYFSHISDTQYGGASANVVNNVSNGSTTVLVNSPEAIDDQIGFADPAQTTTTDTTNVTTFHGSGTINGSTTGFPSSGQLRVGTDQAWSDGNGSWTGAILSYTGTTSNSFTGVNFVRGSGLLSGPILQIEPYKVTSQTCYANDCALTVTPAISGSVTSGTAVANAGTCQLYATAGATPTSPLAPNGVSYWDGCQWRSNDIAVTGNTFSFDPTAMAASAPLTGGGTTTTCDANHTDNCGTNFMAFQEAGEAPFSDFTDGNAMMSSTTFSGCPAWDSGCSTDPLANINATANPPNATANNGEAPFNNVWSNNTYQGPWLWNTDWYGTCGNEPLDSTTGNNMTAGACQVDFSHWQSDWQQDSGSSYSSNTTPPPSTPNNVNATASSSTSVSLTWSASSDSGGPGIGGYYVLRNGNQIASVNSSTTSYTDSLVAANTQYSYTVEAFDTAAPPDVSAASTASVVTTPAAPGAPSILTTVPPNNGSISSNAASVSGTVTPAGSNTISQVQLLLNSALVQTLTSSPFNFTLNTDGYLDGGYTLSVKGTDNQGNSSTENETVYITNGDLTGARKVGISDLAIMANNWGKSSGANYAEGDLNGDGKVNIQDLSILAHNWGISW